MKEKRLAESLRLRVGQNYWLRGQMIYIYWMKRQLIKNKKIDEVGDPDYQERANLCVNLSTAMEDGEKDEEMKPRGGSIENEEREIATYLEMNERDHLRRRCSMIGHRWRRCSTIRHRLRLSTPSPLQVGFLFVVFFPIFVCFQSGLGFCFRDQLGLLFKKISSWPHQLLQHVHLLLGA